MRPHITSHMISSIDGRLDVDRWTPQAPGSEPGLIMRVYENTASQLEHDGWMVGRKTMASMATERAPAPLEDRATPPAPHAGKRANAKLAVAIDPQGKLHYNDHHLDGDHIVSVLAERVAEAYLSELRTLGVSYVFAGPDGRDLAAAMSQLASHLGAKRLLLEGGGSINGAFLKLDLIDEISVLIYPGIDGLASASSIFAYEGAESEQPAVGRHLVHLETKSLEGGVAWLRYRVEHTT